MSNGTNGSPPMTPVPEPTQSPKPRPQRASSARARTRSKPKATNGHAVHAANGAQVQVKDVTPIMPPPSVTPLPEVQAPVAPQAPAAPAAPAAPEAPTAPRIAIMPMFVQLPPLEKIDGPWEKAPSTFFYSAEANEGRECRGLCVARVAWGGGIDAFLFRPSIPMRVRLADGSLFDVPVKACFVAVPAIAELVEVLVRFDQDMEHALAVRWRPFIYRQIEDGRMIFHYDVETMKVPLTREQAMTIEE